MPTVSVLIPNYNRAHMLQDAIRSVLAQTYQDYEMLVVDDGSTEDIPAALVPFGERVRYVRKENGGCASAKNYGLERISGEYIAVLDNDDLWLPGKLERQVAVLESQPDVGMVSCQVFVMDDHSRVLARPPQGVGRETPRVSLAELAEQNVVFGGSSAQMVRTSALRDIGGFDTQIYHDDWDCWVRLARDWQIWMIPEPLAYYRINSRGYRNHAPLPARADSIHRSMLEISERACQHWPDGQADWGSIRARARAREYLRHALVLFAVDRQADGQAAWERAITYDASITTDAAIVKQAVIDCATGYAMVHAGTARAGEAKRVLNNILPNLPQPVRALTAQRAQMEAALLAELAFLAAQQGEATEARTLAWRCLTRDLTWMRNVGLMKLLLTGGKAYWPVPVQEHIAGLSAM